MVYMERIWIIKSGSFGGKWGRDMLARQRLGCYAAVTNTGETIMKRFHQGTAIAFASFFAIGFTTFVATAEELKTAEEIMGFSSAKTATYKTWSADYTESIRMLGNSLAIKGRLMQKLPGKMWMQLDMPMMGQRGTMTMILGEDGILWQISEMGAQPQIMKVDENRVYSNTTALAGAKFKPLELMDPSMPPRLTASPCM